MIQKNIVRRFKDVGLELRILNEPIGNASTKDITQMNVGRKLKGNRRYEWFDLWPGHENNTVQVRGVCKKRHQVVVLVVEPERTFEEEIKINTRRQHRATAKAIKRTLDRRAKVSRTTKKAVYIERKTPKGTRCFLMGLDERQLFIAQVTGNPTTVDQAHRSLGNVVQVHGARRKGSAVDRQGEWFFLETSQGQREAIENAIKKNIVGIEKKVSTGGAGNPHVADELVVMPGRMLEHGFPIRANNRFVRGKIRHVDHKTIKFKHWREVVSNNEAGIQESTFAGSNGNYFID